MLGFHVGKNKRASITAAVLEDVKEFKLPCVQIFTHGPKTSSLNNIDPVKLEAVSKQVRVYVHSHYQTSWKSLDAIHEQISVANLVGATGIVLHLPKMLPEKAAAPVPAMVKHSKKTKIILEMRAIKPDVDSYESPEKILALIKACEDLKLTSQEVGICIDTAHIYAGKAAIQKYEDAKAYLQKLDGKRDWITLLHLNGNEYDAKLRAGDKHCVPFSKKDKIWHGIEYDHSGLRAFLEWFHDKDVILELDFSDKQAQELLRDLQKRK